MQNSNDPFRFVARNAAYPRPVAIAIGRFRNSKRQPQRLRRDGPALRRRWSPAVFLSLPLCLALCASASAQVQLDRLYPPVVSVGTETNIHAEGKFPNWPVKAVVDREDVQLVAGKESGQFTLSLSTDAAPGIAWVRLIDDLSASELMPLLIEPTATTEEVEPNQKIEEATRLDLPAVVYGRLNKANDIDTYRVHLKKGQTFVASVLAHRPLRSPMDAVMQLVDPRGNVIAQADDDRGIDPQLIHFAEEDRELLVRIFAFPEVPTGTIGYAGAASFVYTIRMTNDGYVDHVLPLVQPLDASAVTRTAFGWNLPSEHGVHLQDATNLSPRVAHVPLSLGWQWHPSLSHDAVVVAEAAGEDFATAASLPCVFSGHISEPNQTDRLRLAVKPATRYEAIVHSRSHGFPLDSVLRVMDITDRSELARNDDVARNEYDASVTFTTEKAGEVELQVSDLVDGHSPRHAYSVVIGEALPRVELTVSEEKFAIDPNGQIEIPVAIARKHGFDRELTITADALPEGIHCEPVVSQAEGDTSTAVTLKLVADKTVTYQGPFGITARPAATDDEPSPSASFAATHQLRDAVHLQTFWLTASQGADL